MSDLRQFFMHDTHVHGSVFIWRRRDIIIIIYSLKIGAGQQGHMLCTSGSMDDVTFE